MFQISKITKNIAFIVAVAAISLSLTYIVFAAWSEPVNPPPTCNAGDPGCDAPLNVSSTSQTKQGPLVLNDSGASATGLIVNKDVFFLNGRVGIGPSPFTGFGATDTIFQVTAPLPIPGGSWAEMRVQSHDSAGGADMHFENDINDVSIGISGSHGTNDDHFSLEQYREDGTPNGTFLPRLIVDNTSGDVGIGIGDPQDSKANFVVGQDETGPGTVSNAAGGILVTGVDTQFTNTFKKGDTITIGSDTVVISSVDSDIQLTTASIASAHAGVFYSLVEKSNFVVKGNGNVGIGTEPEDYTLDVSAKDIRLGLDKNGGGNLVLSNDLYDNKIFMEAFSTDMSSSASEVLLTGKYAANLPKISLYADKTYIIGNVGIGATNPGEKLEVNGGVKLNTATVRPACNAAERGTFWVVQGSAGVKDSVAVCAKDAADAYAWRNLY